MPRSLVGSQPCQLGISADEHITNGRRASLVHVPGRRAAEDAQWAYARRHTARWCGLLLVWVVAHLCHGDP